MLNYKNPLLDTVFLNKLASQHERELYAKIIALDMDENPIEEIEGRVTQGSVPVDGNSIVRRTCSLTLVATELNINDYLWGLETKIKLSVGLRNKIDSQYPPVIWFKMGTYILTSFSSQHSSSGYTVSIQGKDKMCLLNGDIGGNLTALSYDFGSVSVISKNGYTYTEKLPLKQIIKKAVHDFGKEPYHNIIINDLDDSGLELLEYRGESPLYFIYSKNTQEISNMTLDPKQTYYLKGNTTALTLESIERTIAADMIANRKPTYVFKSLADLAENTETPTDFYGDPAGKHGPYNIIKITRGMTCGYRTTELVYAGDLTASVGEPITSMLSKIVSMLGNYEYFYNLDGQFVFQKKRTYVNTSWNNMVNNGEEDWVENAAYTASYLFSFEDGNLITSYQNAPNLGNLKNDFSIWGVRKGVTGSEIPIHMRYAIDHKPKYYTTLAGITYTTRTEEEVEFDKQNLGYEIAPGYQKEPSRFGLSEDWWEVRDWAKAWEFSGLPIPSERLGTYCPITAIITDNPALDGQKVNNSNFQEYSYVDPEIHKTWGSGATTYSTDDYVFHSDGTYWAAHGSCGHTYTQWLQAFDPKFSGGAMNYPDGYAYFYKPQVPVDDLAQNGGLGLQLGEKVIYNCDWRELIYQMSLDFNKHGDEDDFLIQIRDRNASWYPTGYTGYEQYYVDINGFWRQLYDPDYKTSYEFLYIPERVFIEESRFHAQGSEDPWYYDAPIYKQCAIDDPFFSEVIYYTLEGEEYVAQKGLLQTEYGKNPRRYYYISDTEIKPIPIVTEPYVASANTYYINNGNGFVVYPNINNVNDYLNQSIHLYKRIEKREYFPAVTQKPFTLGKLYFKLDENGDYRPVTNLIEEIYNANPGDYYERTYVGGVVGFQNCATIAPYAADREYYLKNGEVFTRQNLSKDTYDAAGYANKYYYAVIHYSYIPCQHPKYDYDPNCNYYKESIKEYELNPDSPQLYWNKKVIESPETLNFWFDFLDTYGELSEYAVKEVGDRPKAVNDNNVKAIYFRETPGVIFVENLNELDEKKSGYTYAQLPSHLEYLFSISGQGKSAKDVLDNFLYSYSYCTNSITLSAIPIYHLEPNTRIFVRDDESGIIGEYIITRITFPLDANGTMSINATKVVDRIY